MMPRGERCPSDLSLDRAVAGELAPDEASALASHVERCAFCERRRGALLEARRRFADEAPPFAELARAARPASTTAPGSARSARRGWVAAACALAAAASLALAVGEAWRSAPSDHLGTRTKGGRASLGWVVRRGEHVFAGRPEQRLRPGDAVRFTVSAREPVFVAVLGLGAGGTPSVYYPETAELARVEAGSDQLLPAAIELDASPGSERLLAVFCASAVPVARVLEAVVRSPEAPALPQGCSGEHHRLLAEAR